MTYANLTPEEEAYAKTFVPALEEHERWLRATNPDCRCAVEPSERDWPGWEQWICESCGKLLDEFQENLLQSDPRLAAITAKVRAVPLDREAVLRRMRE